MLEQKQNYRTVFVRTNEQLETWEEPYGGYVVFVERSVFLSSTSRRHAERAYVCRVGDSEKLFDSASSPKTSDCPNRTPSWGLLRGRARAVAWLLATHPEVQDALDGKKHEEALRAVQAHRAAVEQARIVGAYQVLAGQGVGYVSTPDLAKLMGVRAAELNSFLRTAGFATKDGRQQHAVNPAYAHRDSGANVSWNPVGAAAIWEVAFAAGLALEPPDQLLRLLRKRFPYLPAWALIDEAERLNQTQSPLGQQDAAA